MPTANAAAALAQLHNSRPESDWETDRVSQSSVEENVEADRAIHTGRLSRS